MAGQLTCLEEAAVSCTTQPEASSGSDSSDWGYPVWDAALWGKVDGKTSAVIIECGAADFYNRWSHEKVLGQHRTGALNWRPPLSFNF